MYFSIKWQHVMFAHTVEGNIPNQHHIAAWFLKNSPMDNRIQILLITGAKLSVHSLNSLRSTY